MPFNVGPMELVIVLVIALVVLGPKRLPEAGRSVGRGLREFKRAISGAGSDEPEEIQSDRVSARQGETGAGSSLGQIREPARAD
jgi:sec-independent protein translocase protein TatA